MRAGQTMYNGFLERDSRTGYKYLYGCPALHIFLSGEVRAYIQEINEQYADEGGEHNFSESQ